MIFEREARSATAVGRIEGFGPGSSTAISSNPVLSTNKSLDFKVRLASNIIFWCHHSRRLRPQVCEDGLGRAKGKQASSSSPTLNAHGCVEGPRMNDNLEGTVKKLLVRIT